MSDDVPVRERSHVLPAHRYGDPADVAEQDELDDLGCKVCAAHGFTWRRVICRDARNEKQKGVPYVGHRCKWFEEKK